MAHRVHVRRVSFLDLRRGSRRMDAALVAFTDPLSAIEGQEGVPGRGPRVRKYLTGLVAGLERTRWPGLRVTSPNPTRKPMAAHNPRS
jgi:hypothetical protein